MSFINFESLPETSRMWIFSSKKVLSDSETSLITTEMVAFIHQWTAHKVDTSASIDLRYNRFLIIAADENVAKPGGCSIDEMTRRVRMLGETYNTEFIGTPRVEYRDKQGVIHSVPRIEFQQLADSGQVSRDTTVFDNTVTTLADLNDRWEVKAKYSWHARAFDLLENA